MLLLVLDLGGTVAFAASGSLLAARRGFDIVGSLLLGSLAGMGGGTVRDIILGKVPPTSFERLEYLAAAVFAALLVYVKVLKVHRLRRTLLISDAVGLALFCVSGTLIAHNAGANPVAAALLGLTSAVGGGVLRDVVANEVPQIFNVRGVYAIPAFVGAALTIGLVYLDWFNTYTAVGTATVVFLLRVAALKWQWSVPAAVFRPKKTASFT